MAQKRIKRRPVSLAEIRKRLLSGYLRLSLSSVQNYSPVRRLKASSSFLQCSRYRFHGLRFLSLATAFAYRMPAEFRATDLRVKKTCGVRFAPGANAEKIREFLTNSRRLNPRIIIVFLSRFRLR